MRSLFFCEISVFSFSSRLTEESVVGVGLAPALAPAPDLAIPSMTRSLTLPPAPYLLKPPLLVTVSEMAHARLLGVHRQSRNSENRSKPMHAIEIMIISESIVVKPVTNVVAYIDAIIVETGDRGFIITLIDLLKPIKLNRKSATNTRRFSVSNSDLYRTAKNVPL